MKLSIKNLSKTYPNGTKALNDFSLEISTGMFGLLGPNGAGKSTLMRTIATLQEPDSGSIHLDDLDVLQEKQAFRRVLGYLPQEFGVYPKASAQELLNHLAILKGVTNAKERKELVGAMLDRVNLYKVRKKAVSGYSGGMKQRFGIAQVMLGKPKVIIVDEPTAGLDPGERNRFYNLLSEIGEQVIVILSTHIVQDVSQLCRDMAIVNHGELIYHGTPQVATSELEGSVWQKSIDKSEVEHYHAEYRVISSRLVGGRPFIHIYSEHDPQNGFKATNPDLEDVFFHRIMEQQALPALN